MSAILEHTRGHPRRLGRCRNPSRSNTSVNAPKKVCWVPHWSPERAPPTSQVNSAQHEFLKRRISVHECSWMVTRASDIKKESACREDSMAHADPEGNIPHAGKARPIQVPNLSTRKDGFGHFPECAKLLYAMRCRNKNCKRKTRVKCMKCNVFLCLLAKNCFYDFHNPQH
ncbi:uncharacterized protein LOC115320098 isoform X2 [Ixodes scapularis]|uniref:uncharacterized protein LOC115320098 isoform X2 n=1 Tax=Ixodes scapularis TaxID=6945 RepID=UPI001A9E2D05|nr:uncharacterized protein LOC115320098 isoform X2 [Ixodes scapularis]